MILAALLSGAALADTPPHVVSAGPEGEIDALDQANEVRLVFSEPMVALGRIPQPVRAPFMRIDPALAGIFRWSAKIVIPCHYDLFSFNTADVNVFIREAEKINQPYKVLKGGEKFQY